MCWKGSIPKGYEFKEASSTDEALIALGPSLQPGLLVTAESNGTPDTAISIAFNSLVYLRLKKLVAPA